MPRVWLFPQHGSNYGSSFLTSLCLAFICCTSFCLLAFLCLSLMCSFALTLWREETFLVFSFMLTKWDGHHLEKKKYAYSHKVIHNKGNSNGTSEEQKPFRIHSWPNDSTCWEEFLYILYILIHELHALIFFLFLFEWNWMFSVCQGSPFLCFVCIIKPWSKKKKKSYIIDRIYKGLLTGVSVCTWHCQINVWFSSRR